MIYEYTCTNKECNHNWEEDKKISAPKTIICPKCKENSAKRLISKTSFQLKGNGWFKDGY